ncbi:tetratricopeptide repeat protein [Pendulispora rubella]|uniref:Tetratricopeptide repeat protein n=1 Tax=Pendulispora rubella TaxID=2741070 RepID=A0ABZ2LEU1_9BACT
MPIDRESVLQTAQKYAEKKKYDRAIVEYQKIIQVDPSDARTLLKMGDLQVKMGAYADAIATYERVGKHYVSLEFFVKAVWVYKQIGEILHKHVPHLEERYAHIAPQLAQLYQNLGLTSDAMATLDEVATRLQKQQRDSEAIEVFRKTIDLDPNNPIPHLRLAEALSRARDPEGAATVFSTAASLLIRRGRPDDALKVLERLLHHKQDPAQARIAAELYLQRGSQADGLQALAKLQICFQANPKDIDTLALLARAFVVIGQAAKGIEVRKEMARIAREQGKTDLFRRLVNDLLEVAGDDDQVQQLAISLPPDDDDDEESQLAPPPARVNMPQASSPIIEAVELDEELLADDDSAIESIEALSAPATSRAGQTLSLPGLTDTDDVPVFDVPSRLSQVGPRASAPDLTERHASISDDYPEMSIEEADDLLVPTSSEEAIAELLEEAASLRRRRMYTSAIESLRIGLELDPYAMDLRHGLRDVLIEAGRIDDAVDESFATVSLLLDRLDGEGAARALSDILAIDPGNERAVHMLRELGYDAPLPASDSRPATEANDDLDDLYDPDAPLPTYELDELGTAHIEPPSFSDQTVPRGTLPGPPPRTMAARRELAIDDPFGSSELPLPEFPLDPSAMDGARHADTLLDPAAPDPLMDPMEVTSRQSASSRPVVELEDALEEADFFASRGLYGDARAVLREQLSRNPNHPLLLERIQELEMQEHGGAAQTSGTRAVPNSVDERSFDISASLDALENLEEVTGPIDLAALGGQVDVEEVFAKFKEGVNKQIDVDDADMHYDLGIAYREIGKFDDAIREFELAANDPTRTCVCESMIGQIHMDRGALPDAIDAFSRGLAAKTRTPEQETMLAFELGNAYEEKNLPKDALQSYQRVARWNPHYRDVQERIRRLARHESTRTPSRPLAVGAEDDEFDRAFDEIIGDGKLP